MVARPYASLQRSRRSISAKRLMQDRGPRQAMFKVSKPHKVGSQTKAKYCRDSL